VSWTPVVVPVERIREKASKPLFRELDGAETPVVIEGAVEDWPAVRTWSPSVLREKLGDVAVRYKVSESGAHPDFRSATPPRSFRVESAPFSDFLASITEGPRERRARNLFTGDEQFLLRHRRGQVEIHPTLTSLLEDVRMSEVVPEARVYTVWGWFSGPGVRTWLHYDNNGCHNLNVQLTGGKRCWLFPPHELRRLAPFPLGGANPAYNCSQIDVDAPDFERFPELGAVRGFSAELTAGDVLFIPANYWHTFVHDGELNANVNFWWKPERPLADPVALRQALIDAAATARALAGADTTDTDAASLLARLDRALVEREPGW